MSEKVPDFRSVEQAFLLEKQSKEMLAAKFLTDPAPYIKLVYSEKAQFAPEQRVSALIDEVTETLASYLQPEADLTLDSDVAALKEKGVTEQESIKPLFRLLKRSEIPVEDIETWIQNLPSPTEDTPNAFHKRNLLTVLNWVYGISKQ